MPEQGETAGGPYWVVGDMTFRAGGRGPGAGRLVTVPRPFAVVGRGGDADLAAADPSANPRHVYLHLDRRGVYAVDLLTRSGTRFNGEDRPAAWLRPGDRFEVAGLPFELVRVRVDGHDVEPPPCRDEVLSHAGPVPLAGVTLEPRSGGAPPWVLGSELVFLGRSPSCGIPVDDPAVARVQCAVVRTPGGAFLVDLAGGRTRLGDREVRGASALRDGETVALGGTRFLARVGPPDRPASTSLVPQLLPRLGPSYPPALPDLDPDLIPAEAREVLVAWAAGVVHGGQGELLRQQGEFQVAVGRALRQIQEQSAEVLNAHLERLQGIDRELSVLRAEIGRRDAPPPPHATPLRIARPSPDGPAADPRNSTTWLIHRVGQLEDENRSAWKDLLGRIAQPRRSP